MIDGASVPCWESAITAWLVIRAVGATIDLVERVGKPMIFVINGATPRARITSDAVIALSQHGTLAPSIIHHRTDFAASMIDGRTVMELPRKTRSAGEIERLWSYLRGRLYREDPSIGPGTMAQLPPPPVQHGVASMVGEVL